jgi:hypothetical protein
MKARVVTWEGGDPAVIEENFEGIRQRAGSGPPEGIPSVGLLMLQDGADVLAISFFETDADYEQGDATLNAMDPPSGSMGRRTSVRAYDVAIKLEAEGS